MKSTLAVLAATGPLLLAAGCEPPGTASPGAKGGGQVQQAPAAANGECALGKPVVLHTLGGVSGSVSYQCAGAAVLTVTLFLTYDGGTAAKATVSSAIDPTAAVVSAPCRTGTWRLRYAGEVRGVGAALPVGGWSNPVEIVC